MFTNYNKTYSNPLWAYVIIRNYAGRPIRLFLVLQYSEIFVAAQTCVIERKQIPFISENNNVVANAKYNKQQGRLSLMK